MAKNSDSRPLHKTKETNDCLEENINQQSDLYSINVICDFRKCQRVYLT